MPSLSLDQRGVAQVKWSLARTPRCDRLQNGNWSDPRRFVIVVIITFYSRSLHEKFWTEAPLMEFRYAEQLWSY